MQFQSESKYKLKKIKVLKLKPITFSTSAKQLMSSIFSTKIMSGCSTCNKIVVCLAGDSDVVASKTYFSTLKRFKIK